MKAWVVFSGHADLWWLKMLKRGFRHCAVILQDGAHWIEIEPLSHKMTVQISAVPSGFHLPLWLEQQGHKVVSATLIEHHTPAPWDILTCVGVVKRVLGIRKRRIFTPWQLYRHILRHHTVKGDILSWEV